jgi:hypothetical protein
LDSTVSGIFATIPCTSKETHNKHFIALFIANSNMHCKTIVGFKRNGPNKMVHHKIRIMVITDVNSMSKGSFAQMWCKICISEVACGWSNFKTKTSTKRWIWTISLSHHCNLMVSFVSTLTISTGLFLQTCLNWIYKLCIAACSFLWLMCWNQQDVNEISLNRQNKCTYSLFSIKQQLNPKTTLFLSILV